MRQSGAAATAAAAAAAALTAWHANLTATTAAATGRAAGVPPAHIGISTAAASAFAAATATASAGNFGGAAVSGSCGCASKGVKTCFFGPVLPPCILLSPKKAKADTSCCVRDTSFSSGKPMHFAVPSSQHKHAQCTNRQADHL